MSVFIVGFTKVQQSDGNSVRHTLVGDGRAV